MNLKTSLSILLIVVLVGITHFVYAQNKSNLPDVIIKDIFYADEPYIKVKYCNIGLVSSADDFLIKLRNEDTGKEYLGNSYYRFKVPAPRECMITGGYSSGLIGLSYGEKAKVTAIIDWEGRVNESNENNNILTKIIGLCTDSDDGINYYKKGTVTDKYGRNYTDYCFKKYLNGFLIEHLNEYYCRSDGTAGSTRYRCRYGCSNGACIINITPKCTDTDGGKNYYVKGTVIDRYGKRYIDHCSYTRSKYLIEYYCNIDGTVGSTTYYCKYGCNDGACIKEGMCYSNNDCAANQFCEFPEGVCKGPGKCVVKPQYCPKIYSPVCGCDERTYSNDCIRKLKGVSKKHDGECKTETKCTDTDGGKNYYVKGTATNRWGNFTDFCDNSFLGYNLREYYCDKKGEIRTKMYNCPNGCKDGVCVKGKEPYCSAIGTRSEGWYQYGKLIKYDKCNGCYAVCKAIGTKSEGWYSSCDSSLIKYEICFTICTDTDGGKNYYVKGTVTSKSGIFTDKCWAEGELTEYICKDNDVFAIAYQCPNGCQNGACVKAEKSCVKECKGKGYEYGRCRRSCKKSEINIGKNGCPQPEIYSPINYYCCCGKEVPSVCYSNKDCAANQFCEFPEGVCKGPGKCVVKPQECPEEYYCPVCGCDGKTYSNDCVRKLAGISKKHDGECKTETKCTDSDGGKNYYVKGTVTSCTVSPSGEGVCEVFTDKCVLGLHPHNASYPPYTEQWAVEEYYCEGNEVKSVIYNCPNGCKHGACVSTTTKCKDSDGGKNYYVKGTCVDSRGSHTDECIHSASQHLLCKDLCGDGICQKTVCMGPNCPCPETAESCPEDCGSGSSNSQLLEWYCSWSYLENEQSCRPIKITCPNGCKDGACINISSTVVKEKVKCVFENSTEIQKCYTDDGKFGCSGIGTCIADVSGTKGTKLLWKSSCGGYAYTVIDGIDEYAEFKCVLLCKDSCPFEGKCYPFGYRKADKFCSENGSFVKQKKGGEFCENNFECYSNICINGKCASANLVQMIIDWFRKLFGLM